MLDQAREKIDPRGTGFDPLMADYDDGLFSTDEGGMPDWLTVVDPLARVITQAAIRVSLAAITAGTAISGSLLFQTERGAPYGAPMLAVAAIAAGWFAVSSVLAGIRGR
jgi:hypothetical protein